MLKGIFSFFHKLCEVHVVMNIVTALAIYQIVSGKSPWKIFLVFYAIISVAVSVLRIAYFVLKKKPDSEFIKLINKIEERART